MKTLVLLISILSPLSDCFGAAALKFTLTVQKSINSSPIGSQRKMQAIINDLITQ